jgi:bifunctional DNA-binding transcriptional regulator/antitoxin component of YhaV-PrlF toxin-antitoxin module
MKYTSIVQEDENGELYIIIPDDLVKELGWGEGTELVWTIDGDTVNLSIKEEKDD